MRNVVIAGYARSPFTLANKGALMRVRPDDMAARVISALIARTGVKPQDIEDVILGCAFPEGEQGFNIGRVVALLAGLPLSVAGMTVNRFCGSSMQSVHIAAGQISLGAGEVFIAAGVESMSRVPMMGFNPLPNPAMQSKGPAAYISMGETAENVASKWDISRDVRIAMIYEGTNGVQALDLVGRKLPANMGRSLRRFFHPIAQFIHAHERDPQIGPLVQSFAESFGALQLATALVVQAEGIDPEEAGAAATDYLRMFGLVALGFMWVRMAKVAADTTPGTAQDAAFYRAKRATATFYIQRILPQTGALLHAIQAGKASMTALEETAF
jgi:hypothetical protein